MTDHYPRSGTPLTKTEVEILELMAQGLTDREIARRTYRSVETIKTHDARLKARLSARNRAHAIWRGVELGYLTVVRTDEPRGDST